MFSLRPPLIQALFSKAWLCDDPVFSTVLSSAVNCAQLHIGHRLTTFIPHLRTLVYHSITFNSPCLPWKMKEMYVTIFPYLLVLFAFILLYSSQSFQEIDFATPFSLIPKSVEASKWFPCCCPFLCCTACPPSPGTKQATF